MYNLYIFNRKKKLNSNFRLKNEIKSNKKEKR